MAMKYSTAVKKAGLKIGDTVKVKRKTSSHANGWRSPWGYAMNVAIGKTGTIASDPASNMGVKVKGVGCDSYYFPVFVLEKVNVVPSAVAAELNVTDQEVRQWIKNPFMCNGWKVELKEQFDLYSNNQFTVDVDWLKEGYDEARDELKKQLIKRFPLTLGSTPAVKWISYADAEEEFIDGLEDILENYSSDVFESKIPGATRHDKAVNIAQVLHDHYNKK